MGRGIEPAPHLRPSKFGKGGGPLGYPSVPPFILFVPPKTPTDLHFSTSPESLFRLLSLVILSNDPILLRRSRSIRSACALRLFPELYKSLFIQRNSVYLVIFRMTDFEREFKEGEETSARAVDWEVVSLTASAYDAAPGPEGSDLADGSIDKEFNKNEEYARAMFMSGHFVFPPSEHENLPIVPDDAEILSKSQVQDVDMIEVETDVAGKIREESWKRESISEANDIHVVQFFDKGERLCASSMELEEGKTAIEGLNLVNEVKNLYMDPGFGSFHAGTGVGGTVSSDEITDISESDDPINQGRGCSPKSVDKSKCNVSKVPSESWWKKQVASFYAQAKEASTFWSLCVAAALMGLVILGQRWQRERWQVHAIRSQFSINDEKLSKLLGPVTRFKDVVAGGHRRAAVLQAGSSTVL